LRADEEYFVGGSGWCRAMRERDPALIDARCALSSIPDAPSKSSPNGANDGSPGRSDHDAQRRGRAALGYGRHRFP
jgi:hypothetical protein